MLSDAKPSGLLPSSSLFVLVGGWYKFEVAVEHAAGRLDVRLCMSFVWIPNNSMARNSRSCHQNHEVGRHQGSARCTASIDVAVVHSKYRGCCITDLRGQGSGSTYCVGMQKVLSSSVGRDRNPGVFAQLLDAWLLGAITCSPGML